MPPLRRALVVALAAPLSMTAAQRAGAQTVHVEAAQRLSAEPQPFPLVESFLAVNPTDPSNLLASAMAVTAEESVVYASWDAGATWHAVEGPQGVRFPGGDPMVAFDGHGRAYFATITPFRVWRSADGGHHWEGPAVIQGGPGGYDREWLAAPQAGGGNERPLVLFGASKRTSVSPSRREDLLVTAVSADGGASFRETVVPVDSGYLHTVTDLLVRRNGTVAMALLVNYARVPGEREMYRGRRWVRLSRDSGKTWSPARFGTEDRSYGNSARDFAMKGLGGGALAEDPSDGPLGGRLYLTWPTVIDGWVQIMAAYSADGGVTWSHPVRVNDGGFASNHSVPTVAVNGRGVVAVTWNDRRDDPTDACFRHVIALSTDGGRTFSAARPVSDSPTCPPPGSRWANGGDTNGLVALPDGSFRVTWTAGRGRDLAIWTAVVHPAAGAMGGR